jgi:hypothetical protein
MARETITFVVRAIEALLPAEMTGLIEAGFDTTLDRAQPRNNGKETRP